MSVCFHIPAPLREFSGGRSEVEIDCSPITLADALNALWIAYPGLQHRVATEQGEIREHVNIFIGDSDIRFTGGLASHLSEGSDISIVPSISGG
jgi:molybdopterin converting factor small subunit